MYKTSKSKHTEGHKSSRDRVLDLLEAGKGNYLSGEYIASQLGISRTAVWKAVAGLRKDGYTIDAVTNRGYALSPKSDILSAEGIRRYLGEIASSGSVNLGLPDNSLHMFSSGIFGPDILKLEVSDVVDSTNDVCLRMAQQGEHGGFAAIAGSQTRGRGRRGRTFFSPDGTGLYMSILLRPFGINGIQAQRFTTISAVAVAEAIEAVAGIPAEIKWVNDVYVSGRKVCGILTEASVKLEDSTLDYAVVGIGINVYEPEGGFPESIRDRAGSLATSLYQHDSGRSGLPSGTSLLENGGRNRLAAEILSRFYSYCIAEFKSLSVPYETAYTERRYLNEYRRRCFVIGREINVLKAGSAPVPAVATGIDDECRLQVRYRDGSEETLSSGEISIGV